MKFKEDGTCKADTSDGKPKKLGERDIVPGIALFSRTHCRSSLQDIAMHAQCKSVPEPFVVIRMDMASMIELQ